MRRAIIALLISLVLVSVVFAENQNAPSVTKRMGSNGSESGVDGQSVLKNKTGPVMMQNDTMLHIGLSNALMKVQNENARQALERNMARFVEKYQARLANLSDEDIEVEEIEDGVKIKAQEPVRYFGVIKGKAKTNFEIDSNGKITEKAPWYRFLYTKEE